MKPPLLHADQAQLPQPLLRAIAPASHHLVGLLLNLLHFTAVFFIFELPKLDTVFQVWSNECLEVGREGDNNFPQSLGPLLGLIQPRTLLTFSAARSTLLAHAQLGLRQYPKGFLSKAAPQPGHPGVHHCNRIFLPQCRARHFIKFFLAQSFSPYSSSEWLSYLYAYQRFPLI